MSAAATCGIMPDTRPIATPFLNFCCACGQTPRTHTTKRRAQARLQASLLRAMRAISIENRGSAVIFIKSPALPDFLYQSEQKFRLSELLSRFDLSELQARYIASIESVVSIEFPFSAPQDRTRSIRKRTPGCLSAVWARNRQLCGTRWFLLNAARFPA